MSDQSILQVGQNAPTFRAASTTGEIDLDAFKGKQSVVLYFYPKADTPGCTKESCAFRDNRSDFARRGVAVIGVSADAVEAQQAFAQKYGLGFPLVADTDRRIINAYGVWGTRTRPDGTSFDGIRRWTFLIDKTGTIRKVYQNVTPEEHAAEILKDIESLGIS